MREKQEAAIELVISIMMIEMTIIIITIIIYDNFHLITPYSTSLYICNENIGRRIGTGREHSKKTRR